MCGRCSLSFCCECRAGWHGLSPCADLASRWRAADEAGRAALRAKHGPRVMEEVESAQWVVEHTRPCPSCSAAVEKNGGCNHMACRSCSYEWCWLCNRKYEQGHYGVGSCSQFSADFWDEIRAAGAEVGEEAFEAHPNWAPDWELDVDW